MRAIRLHRFGGPEALKLEETPAPEVGEGQGLIEVTAASVNPVDVKIRKGEFPGVTQEDLPVTLGRDVAGVVVEAAGPFKVGDEVYAHLDWSDGGYADYARMDPKGAALKPRSLSMSLASGVPLAATTAWQGLFDHGRLKSGERVLIHGASGGVGAFAVQFARLAEAEVYATASGDGVEMVEALGADVAIDYNERRFEEVATDMDLVLDLVGGETQSRSFTVLKPGGALISSVSSPDPGRAAAAGVRAERYMAEPDGRALARFAELIDQGQVKASLSRIFELADAGSAHRCLETTHPRGKVILRLRADGA